MFALQRCPVEQELLKPHVRPRTQLHVQAHRIARFERRLDR